MTTDPTRPLAPSELALMLQLWSGGPRSARALREALYPDSAKAQHGTVQRLLQRLEDKGFVARDRARSVQRFAAVITRAEYGSAQLESLAAKLTGGSLAPLLTHLLERERLPQREIERLRRVLDAAPSASNGSRPGGAGERS